MNPRTFTPQARRRGYSLIVILLLLPMAILGAMALLKHLDLLHRADARALLQLRAEALADGALERLATLDAAQWERQAGTVLFEDKLAGYGPYRATVAKTAGGVHTVSIEGRSADAQYEARCTILARAADGKLAVVERRCHFNNAPSPGSP